MYKYTNYYCDVCDKSKRNLKSLTHNEFEKCVLIIHTMNSPSFIDIDEIFNEYIIDHNKKFDLWLVESEFNIVFVVSEKQFNKNLNNKILLPTLNPNYKIT